jgi:hypothetical protein
MTFLEAAEQILRTSKGPLTASEITEEAIRRGLIVTRGKTPVASMSAALYTAPPDALVKRSFKRGPRRAARGSVRWSYVVRSRRG